MNSMWYHRLLLRHDKDTVMNLTEKDKRLKKQFPFFEIKSCRTESVSPDATIV